MDSSTAEAAAGPSHVRLAPVQPLSRSRYIHLEYPGLIAQEPQKGVPDAFPSSSSAPSSSAVRLDNLGDARSREEGRRDSSAPSHSPPSSSSSSTRLTPLDRALETLSPTPPPYSNVGSALDHLGRLISLKSRAIECRIGLIGGANGGISSGREGAAMGQSPHEKVNADATPANTTTTEIYRHPLIGDLVQTDDLVAVVHRRVWRRKKKRAAEASKEGAGTAASTSAAEAETAPETIKEYTVDTLGVAGTTARWRRMADFNFQPDLAENPSSSTSGSASQDAIIDMPGTGSNAVCSTDGQRGKNGYVGQQDRPAEEADSAQNGDAGTAAMLDDETARRADPDGPDAAAQPVRGGILALHDALMWMDVASLRSFRVPEEKEEYEVETVKRTSAGQQERQKASALRLVPPPVFSRVDVPFPYL